VIDGGVHDRAAVLLAIRRQIGAASCKTEAQRRARAYQHRAPFIDPAAATLCLNLKKAWNSNVETS
jgi:hypothetical protein